MTQDEAGTGVDAEQLRARNRELSILNAIAESLNREVDLGRALETTLAQVAESLDLHTGWIWLLEDRIDHSYLAAAQNLPPGLVNNTELMEGTCYCLDTYRRGDMEGAANVNVVTCSRLQALVDGTDGLRYHASVPLYAAGERKLGVLNVASADWRELSPDDLRLLYTVGDLLSIAVERARLFQQSSELGALEERNRLAREIHDTLAQGLAATALQLEAAEANLEGRPEIESARNAVRKALALTQDSLDEARRSVLDLRAAPLEGSTLEEALAALGRDLSNETDLDIEFETDGHPVSLPSSVEVGLYRMAQEALSNVVRHSGATRVTMRLVSRPGEILLSVTDDGKGFDPALVPKDRYGLVGINERAALLGGRMAVESEVGTGTRIDILVPLGPTGSASSERKH